MDSLTEAKGQAWSDDAESMRRLELANEPYSERDGSLVQLAQADTAAYENTDINAKMNPGHRSIEQYAQAAVLSDNPAADAALKAGPSGEAAPSSLFSDWNTILFLGFGGFILSQAAGNDEPSQGVSKSRDVSGTSINRYLDGATVFIDINNNGQADAGEPSAKTDQDGKFSLTVPEGVEGNLVVMGGTNTSTGRAFKGMMKAPPGSTVVTPLTTLVAELVKPGVFVQQAEQKVVAALGLSSGSKLINVDPIKEAAIDSATFKVHQTVAMLSNDVTSKLLNATGNTNKASEFADPGVAARKAQLLQLPK